MPAKNRRPRSRRRERRAATIPPQPKRKSRRNPIQPPGKSWQDRLFSIVPALISLAAAIINCFKS